MHVCKQTFCKLYGQFTWEFLGFRIRNFQGIIFIWTQTYREIFKSELVYFKMYENNWTTFIPTKIEYIEYTRFVQLNKSTTLKFCPNLTLSWRRSLSYRNQSADLFCKSMDWFLYDRDLTSVMKAVILKLFKNSMFSNFVFQMLCWAAYMRTRAGYWEDRDKKRGQKTTVVSLQVFCYGYMKVGSPLLKAGQ